MKPTISLNFNHAQRLTIPEQRTAAKEFVKQYGAETAVSLAQQFLDESNVHKRIVGLYLLLFSYPWSSAMIEKKIFMLADDEHWEVREVIALILRKILEKDFDRWFIIAQKLASSQKTNQIRAAIVGTMISKIDEKQAQQILTLYAPHLKSTQPYIKKNLGPFALAHMARHVPSITFAFMKKISADEDGMIRWNLLMAFSQRLGKEYPEKAREFLQMYKSDDRVVVRRAVKSLERILEKNTGKKL